jgi:broad specificity phosphatase PhoE
MKKLLLLFLSLAFFFSSGQEKEAYITKVILVRHAEKADDGTRNPSLSEAGKTRAKRLAEMLKDIKIDEAYSTPYKRTTETITPICLANQITIQSYDAFKPTNIEEAVKNGSGKTIIVAGHSNTVPFLVNTLIKEEKFTEMDESDYGKLWILTFRNHKLVDITLLNY